MSFLFSLLRRMETFVALTIVIVLFSYHTVSIWLMATIVTVLVILWRIALNIGTFDDYDKKQFQISIHRENEHWWKNNDGKS